MFFSGVMLRLRTCCYGDQQVVELSLACILPSLANYLPASLSYQCEAGLFLKKMGHKSHRCSRLKQSQRCCFCLRDATNQGGNVGEEEEDKEEKEEGMAEEK